MQRSPIYLVHAYYCSTTVFLLPCVVVVVGEGKVYVWDMSARECVNVFVDEGCINGTTIAVSPDSQYVACGSSSGVVNLYSAPTCLQAGSTCSHPKPLKAIMNLTTRIDALSINPTRYYKGIFETTL